VGVDVGPIHANTRGGGRKIPTLGVEDTPSPSSCASAAPHLPIELHRPPEAWKTHRRPPRVRAPPPHLPIELRRPRIFPYERCFSKFAAGHVDVVILDPDECVCHLHGSSTDLGKHLHSSRFHGSSIQTSVCHRDS
jgi:hypothetical protein